MSVELITRFYTAFQAKDAEGMAACYAPDIRFSDPVFPDLQGAHAGNMWRMLCSRGKDLEVTFSDVTCDGDTATAHWEAHYTFSTGNKVHNKIDATFELRDGLIVKHTDVFDLSAWAGQALGLVGKLFGWLPPLQNKIRGQAADGLARWEARHGG